MASKILILKVPKETVQRNLSSYRDALVVGGPKVPDTKIYKNSLEAILDDYMLMYRRLKKLGVEIKLVSGKQNYSKMKDEDVIPAFLRKQYEKSEPKQTKKRRTRL